MEGGEGRVSVLMIEGGGGVSVLMIEGGVSVMIEGGGGVSVLVMEGGEWCQFLCNMGLSNIKLVHYDKKGTEECLPLYYKNYGRLGSYN